MRETMQEEKEGVIFRMVRQCRIILIITISAAKMPSVDLGENASKVMRHGGTSEYFNACRGLVVNRVRCSVALAVFVVASLALQPGVSAPAPKPKIEILSMDGEGVAPAHTKVAPAIFAFFASAENMKQLGEAAQNHQSAYGYAPFDITDKNDKPLLSWRVNMLPYLGHLDLWQEFNTGEAWDSEHNKKLIEKMPSVFSSPRVAARSKGYTVYVGFTGEGSLLKAGKRVSFRDMKAATRNTIMFVESSVAVPWTKPIDIPFDREKLVPDFGKSFHDCPLCVLCDGTVRTLDLKTIRTGTLNAAIVIDGAKKLGPDWK